MGQHFLFTKKLLPEVDRHFGNSNYRETPIKKHQS
jgi:hypothetical protein